MPRDATFKLSLEIEARGCKTGRLARLNNKMFKP